jgi:beta-galactosidase/beta-glucuronidase
MPDELLLLRRTFSVPEEEGRTLLHFGAVDQECCVYVNGRKAGYHMGGFLPFSIDVTGFVKDMDEITREILLTDGTKIPVEAIIGIESAVFGRMETD